MVLFDIGIKIFIVLIIIFFLSFGYACYLWSDVNTRKERLIIAFMTSFLYSYLIFLAGVIILGLIYFFWKNFPNFLKIFYG